MPTENLAVLAVYTSVVALAVLCLFPLRRANPVFWFLPFKWLIAAGTIAVVDLSRESDVVYVFLFFISLLAFLGGAYIGIVSLRVRRSYHRFWSRPVTGDSPTTRLSVVLLVLLSVLVTAVYYYTVGYNLLLDITLGKSISDFTSARLAAYSGEQYFAPGYVNQFKNVLLPLGISAMGGWAWYSGNRGALVALVLIGIPVLLLALLGAGQRAFMVYALCAFLFGLAALTEIRKTHLAVAVAVALPLFGLFSFYLGRIEEMGFGAVLLEFLQRMFVTQQKGGIVGFRYIFSLETAWFTEWGQAFLGMLPGRRGSDLHHMIFGIMYGTTRGTAPLSTLASVFYNGGPLGVLIVYLAMGWGYTYLFSRLLLGPRTIFRCFTYGAIFFYLAFFVSGGPMSLVNKGIVTLFILLLIRRLRITAEVPRRNRVTPQANTYDLPRHDDPSHSYG